MVLYSFQVFVQNVMWVILCLIDILTPLPAMGIDFTMVESKGPKILNPIENLNDIKKMKIIEDPNEKLPFVGKILRVSDFTAIPFSNREF